MFFIGVVLLCISTWYAWLLISNVLDDGIKSKLNQFLYPIKNTVFKNNRFLRDRLTRSLSQYIKETKPFSNGNSSNKK
ncbi:hypothetical protein [Prochlorococcus marinus]|uniref:hypothetical protein n=1 Tax=Prochlorococcus marinus TaxID=1219 RepID=UPI0022B30DF2|nr:hypothetical protein [Prochlorococcus marinus]